MAGDPERKKKTKTTTYASGVVELTKRKPKSALLRRTGKGVAFVGFHYDSFPAIAPRVDAPKKHMLFLKNYIYSPHSTHPRPDGPVALAAAFPKKHTRRQQHHQQQQSASFSFVCIQPMSFRQKMISFFVCGG